MFGFRWLSRERLGWMGQGAGGKGVRREAEGRDGGSWDMRAEVWILRAETTGTVGGLRARGREGGCWGVSGQTGGEAVSRLHGRADGQVLFICHDS